MRDFALEVYFEKWEFTSKYNLCASDIESITVGELLAMSGKQPLSSLEDLSLGYTETWGNPHLRDQIAALYETGERADILCAAGTEEILQIVMQCALTKDDHAIITTPNYQSAETIPVSLCATTGIPLDASNDWQIDLDRLEDAIRPNTRLIYINYPNNPTGKLLANGELDAIVALARKHSIILASDEIFRGQEHDENRRLPQVMDLYENGVSINGFSKLYALPGLRIGWAASKNHDLLQRMERHKHYGSMCSSAPSEHLAIAALDARDSLLARNKQLGDNLMAVAKAFFARYPDLFDWYDPDATYFAYPRYRGPEGVERFVEDANSEIGVLFAPASVFQSELTDTPTDRFRVGFTRSIMPQALEILADWLESRKPAY